MMLVGAGLIILAILAFPMLIGFGWTTSPAAAVAFGVMGLGAFICWLAER